MVRIFECLLRMHVWRPRWENHKFMGSLNLKMKTFPKQTKQKITVVSRENLSQTLFMLYYIFIDKTIKSLWGRQSSLKNNMYGLLRFIFFILIVCICVCVYTWVKMPMKDRKGLWTFWSWSCLYRCPTWILSTKFRFSEISLHILLSSCQPQMWEHL